MNKDIIPHVFASLQTLERYLDTLRSLCCDESSRTLKECEKIVREMRRVANHLQLEFASKNLNAVIRSLQIFYGLNQMVRPELLTAILAANKNIQLEVKTSESVSVSH